MASGFETYEQAVKNFWVWQYGQSQFSPSFAVKLIDLYRSADSENKRKLATIWPNLKQAHDDWEAAGDYGKDLFREHGHPVPG